MKGKFIHIAEDEKFINSAYLLFEKAAYRRNEFYILMPKIETNPQYVIPKERIFFSPNTVEVKFQILNEIKKKDVVFVHSLSPSFYEIILRISPSIKIIWLLFGYEVYNDPNFYSDKRLLAPITRNNFPNSKANLSWCEKLKDSIRPFAKMINGNIVLTPAQIKKTVFERIDYIGIPYKEEFRVICSLINMRKKLFIFTYFPLEQIVDVDKKLSNSKTNLLIGHSGFKTGNHLDILDIIKNKDLTSIEKIILPLGYGDKEYIEKIIEIGRRNFSGKLEPIITFQSLKKYNKILETTGIAILYNRRQQGIGNTISLIWFGSKVFLSKYNSFYKFLTGEGISVYNIEEDLKLENSLSFLDLKVQITNRLILKELFNESKILEILANQLRYF